MLHLMRSKLGSHPLNRSVAWSYGEVKKPETINYRTLKPETGRTCSVSAFSAPPRIGSAIAESTKRSAIRARSATAAAWRLPAPRCVASAWATLSWPLPFPTSGISRVSLPAWVCCLDIIPRILEKVLYFAAYIVTDPGETPLIKEPDPQRKGIPRLRVRSMKMISRLVWAPKR